MAEQPSSATLTVTGEVDLASTPALRETVTAALHRAGLRRLVLNFTAVTFLDCAAITTLLMLADQARARQIQLQVTDCSPLVRRVLTLTQADHLIAAPHPPAEEFPAALTGHFWATLAFSPDVARWRFQVSDHGNHVLLSGLAGSRRQAAAIVNAWDLVMLDSDPEEDPSISISEADEDEDDCY